MAGDIKMLRKRSYIIGFVFFVCVALLTAVIPMEYGYAVDIGYECSPEYKGSIFYTRLTEVELTGDMRVDIVSIAKSQIGYHEGDSITKYDGMSKDADAEYSEYGYWYYNNVTRKWGRLYNAPWCAMFVSWCARQANISTDIIANAINAVPISTDPSKDGRHFNVEEKTRQSGYIPQPGDLIMFDWTKTGQRWSHVGLVCDVLENGVEGIQGKAVITIEGNSSNKVALRAYSINDVVIRAYGVPKYVTSDHVHTWNVTKQTSCTHSGSKICTSCGETAVIGQIEHQYWNWGDVVKDEDKPKFKHTDKEPTCTEEGEKSFHCIRCGYKDQIEKIPATDHAYSVSRRVEPTCRQNGMIYYVCGNDALHTYEEKIGKISHVESDWIVDEAATYLKDGKRHSECKFCKLVMNEEVIPRLVDSTAPTGSIEVNGVLSDTFGGDDAEKLYVKKAEFVIFAEDKESGIGKVYYFVSSAKMSMDEVKGIKKWTQAKNGSIENDGNYIIYVKITDMVGNTTYISSGEIEVDTVCPVILGIENKKVYCTSADFTVNEDSTVTVNSVKLIKNSMGYYQISRKGTYTVTAADRAGNFVTVTITVNASHSPGNSIEETKATCTGQGKRVQYCTVCDNVLKTEAIKALGHDAGKWVTVKEVTCTENGIKQRMCTRCEGVIEKITEEAQGHISSQWTVQKAATCTRDGKEIRYCLTCAQTVEENIISAQGHILSDWVVLSDATCTVDGKAVKYCTVCHEHIREQQIPATGHDDGNWFTEAEPTCTEEGHNVKMCLKCMEVIEEEFVPKSGHKLSYGKCVVCGYSTPARWIIICATVVGMILYVTLTVMRDVRQKRSK